MCLYYFLGVEIIPMDVAFSLSAKKKNYYDLRERFKMYSIKDNVIPMSTRTKLFLNDGIPPTNPP